MPAPLRCCLTRAGHGGRRGEGRRGRADTDAHTNAGARASPYQGPLGRGRGRRRFDARESAREFKVETKRRMEFYLPYASQKGFGRERERVACSQVLSISFTFVRSATPPCMRASLGIFGPSGHMHNGRRRWTFSYNRWWQPLPSQLLLHACSHRQKGIWNMERCPFPRHTEMQKNTYMG